MRHIEYSGQHVLGIVDRGWSHVSRTRMNRKSPPYNKLPVPNIEVFFLKANVGWQEHTLLEAETVTMSI